MPDLRCTLEANAAPNQVTRTATGSGTAAPGVLTLLIPDGMTNGTLRRTLEAMLQAARTDTNVYRG